MSTQNNEPVKIIPSVIKNQIDSGWKMSQLKEHYGLPETQMKLVLKQLNLTIRKFHMPKFVILEENVEEVQQVPETEYIVEDVAEVAEITEVTQNTEEIVETVQTVVTTEETPINPSDVPTDAPGILKEELW